MKQNNILTNKKASTIVLVVVGLVIIVLLGFLIRIATYECLSDNDCKNNQYCTVEHICRDATIVQSNGFLKPALFIGFAIIIAAIIVRYNR